MKRTAAWWLSRAAGVAFLGAAVVLVVFLRMSGRSVRYAHVADSQLDRAPQDGVFEAGPLRWNVDVYAKAPSLEPLRQFFGRHCSGRSGLDASVCISDVFASNFTEDEPKRELFDPYYDPVQDLEVHLAGEAGHCVTRSGLSATILLANGIPARLVQMFVPGAPGHNVLEVWDSRWGWVVFDPTFKRTFETSVGPRSAFEAIVQGGHGEWVRRSGKAATEAPAAFRSRSPGSIRFPEPWLYTRTGPHAARWPFRALFVHGGPFEWEQGRGQETLRFASIVLTAIGVALTLMSLLVRSKHSRTDGSVAAPLAQATGESDA